MQTSSSNSTDRSPHQLDLSYGGHQETASKQQSRRPMVEDRTVSLGAPPSVTDRRSDQQCRERPHRSRVARTSRGRVVSWQSRDRSSHSI